MMMLEVVGNDPPSLAHQDGVVLRTRGGLRVRVVEGILMAQVLPARDLLPEDRWVAWVRDGGVSSLEEDVLAAIRKEAPVTESHVFIGFASGSLDIYEIVWGDRA